MVSSWPEGASRDCISELPSPFRGHPIFPLSLRRNTRKTTWVPPLGKMRPLPATALCQTQRVDHSHEDADNRRSWVKGTQGQPPAGPEGGGAPAAPPSSARPPHPLLLPACIPATCQLGGSSGAGKAAAGTSSRGSGTDSGLGNSSPERNEGPRSPPIRRPPPAPTQGCLLARLKEAQAKADETMSQPSPAHRTGAPSREDSRIGCGAR